MLVDGLEADIATKGSVDLRVVVLIWRPLSRRKFPPPGVAAAFAVNPIARAAVFAASKVLCRYVKGSILRYRITGPVDAPQINEVLRQPIKESQQISDSEESAPPQ